MSSVVVNNENNTAGTATQQAQNNNNNGTTNNNNVATNATNATPSEATKGGVGNIVAKCDEWVKNLMECKPLAEADVKQLCQMAREILKPLDLPIEPAYLEKWRRVLRTVEFYAAAEKILSTLQYHLAQTI